MNEALIKNLIERSLVVGKFGLEYEVRETADTIMKENPNLTYEEAFLLACDEWDC